MMANVEDAVRGVFGSINPKADIPLDKISSLILDVRRVVEGATPEERRFVEVAGLSYPRCAHLLQNAQMASISSPAL